MAVAEHIVDWSRPVARTKIVVRAGHAWVIKELSKNCEFSLLKLMYELFLSLSKGNLQSVPCQIKSLCLAIDLSHDRFFSIELFGRILSTI